MTHSLARRSFQEHLDPQVGPKRILALDGGGIRGMLSLGILARIEELVGRPLHEHFDLIGGTSTGALIATQLALGESVESIRQMYMDLGEDVFKKSFFRKGVTRVRFPAYALEAALESKVGRLTLGSDKLNTGLAIVCKRLDTGSPWVLHNNPNGPFYGSGPSWVANSQLLLKDLLRASTAAPTYFSPTTIAVGVQDGRAEIGLFVDGGVSPHNNPALQLIMLALLEGHGYSWPTGIDNLSITSVGTGTWQTRRPPVMSWKERIQAKLSAGIPAINGLVSLHALMADASALNETMLQWLGTSTNPRSLDMEIGTLANDDVAEGGLFRYERFDAPLELDWLRSNIDPAFPAAQVSRLQAMDRAESLSKLWDVGVERGKAIAQPMIA